MLAAVVAAMMGWARADSLPPGALTQDRPANAVALAVLGDSNSHSYQDSLAFPPGSPLRGGAQRSRTFNWVEVLARLRGREVDPGPWLVWGSSGLLASGREALGLDGGRAPRKLDYLYNFANSGAGCDDLMVGRHRQAPRLVALMDKEPARWQRGVVVIRIGLNDWSPLLQAQARGEQAGVVDAAIARCRQRFSEAIGLIRARHAATRILVVGIGNEIDDPGQFEYFRSAAEIERIGRALERFNGALKEMAARTPNAAFFDDAAWFRARWGQRGPQGQPDYRSVRVGPDFFVANTAGDAPQNALVADHHAGLVWNALWAQSLVARLREAFGVPVTPIGDEELWAFLRPLVRLAKP